MYPTLLLGERRLLDEQLLLPLSLQESRQFFRRFAGRHDGGRPNLRLVSMSSH